MSPELDPLRTVDLPAPPTDSTVDITAGVQPDTEPTASGPAGRASSIPGYQITAEIARGGMGRVLAGRELALDREVAIKVLLPNADPIRFVTESKITAALPHPNIPPVYALGALADGSPYLAMKYIRGRTLAAELRRRPDPTADRPRFLQIFEQIANAVGFAHSRGVIHRDLKPANVMVGEFGEVQVMDWGLAREMRAADRAGGGTNGSGDDAGTTQAGTVMGTPAYMAPEQARGEPTDARADVFALGGILTAILTGKAVFSGDSAARTIQSAARGDTAGALTRLSACGADLELVGVAVACLQADRDDRPADGRTVAALVAAYRHGVETRLLQAETARAAALVREAEQRKRRRVLAWSAATTLAVLVAGIVGTTIGLVRAENRRVEAEDARHREKDRADGEARAKDGERAAKQRETERANGEEKAKAAALAYANKTLAALRATTGEDVEKLIGARSELSATETAYLEAIVGRWREFARQEGADDQARRFRAEGHFNVARLWQKMGRRAEARAEYEAARDLRQKLANDFPAQPEHRQELATTHDNLGVLLSDLGERTQAKSEYAKARDLQRQLLQAFPASLAYQHDLALTHNNLGNLLADLGERDEALREYGLARDLRMKLNEAAPAVPDYQNDLAVTQANIGLLLRELGQREAACIQCEKARDLRVALVEAHPTRADYQKDLADSYLSLALLRADAGQRDKASGDFENALRFQRKLATAFPAVPDYQQALATTYINLGDLHRDRGELDTASAEYGQAQGLLKTLTSSFPGVAMYPKNLAAAHERLGTLLIGLGERAEAFVEYERALDRRKKLAETYPAVPEYQVELGGSYCNFGGLVRESGKPADSLDWFRKAIDTLRPVHEKDPRYGTARQFLRNSYWGRADALARLGEHEDAIKDWDHAVALSERGEQPGVRALRADSRLRAGEVATAVADVEELRAIPDVPANFLYGFARIYSVASSKLVDQKRALADRAIETLRGAVRAGFKHPERMATDEDLDPLRDRDDFKQLLADLTKQFPPPRPAPKK